MEAKQEMKQLRNWVREALRNLRADPYCAAVASNVEVRFVKWDKSNHSVLVCIRDTSRPETNYHSQFCRWEWVYTYSRFAQSEISRAIGNLMCCMQHPELNHYPF